MATALHYAYILHQRPYRESSLLIDIFSRDQGRRRLVAKGVRGGKRSKAGLLQAYQPLLLSWVGRSELQTLTQSETAGERHTLPADRNICGLYLNELLLRLTAIHDPSPMLFMHYEQALAALAAGEQAEIVLRLFEKHMLEQIGYGLSLSHDADTGLAITVEQAYYYQAESGLHQWRPTMREMKISGRSLQQLAAETDFDTQSLQEIKQMMRGVLQHFLGDKPLKSRQLMADLHALRPAETRTDK